MEEEFEICNMVITRDDILDYILEHEYPDVDPDDSDADLIQSIVNELTDEEMKEVAHYMSKSLEYTEAYYYGLNYAFDELLSEKFNGVV